MTCMSHTQDRYLTHQWVLAGIASAAARFVPVPLVDDLIRDRSRRFAIARTLSSHDRSFGAVELRPLYDNSRGFFGTMVGKVAALPMKLALYPIRKLVRMFGSVRGVPLDLMRTYLMAHTVDRCLARGYFNDTAPDDHRTEQARAVRVAFDEAFDGIDWRAAKSLFSDTMEQVGHWRSSTVDLARQVFASDETDPDRLDAAELERPSEVRRGAEKVEAMLDRPEIAKLIDDFDQRFDRALV